jgi:hypothetical protein
VDINELRDKLRGAKVTGTSDEQPEQAGRRQMAIEVSDEMLHVVLTDPVIVEAGKEALRAVNERAAAAANKAAAERAGDEGAGEEPSGEEAESASATSTVIRGDLPLAAGLADVWLELHRTLETIAAPTAGRTARRARKLRPGEFGTAEPAEESEPEEPGKASAATS